MVWINVLRHRNLGHFFSPYLNGHSMKKWKLWKVCSHKLFELSKKSLRFQCDSVKCDQNNKSFFNLRNSFTAWKNGSYGKVYSHKLFRALNKSLRFQCDSVKCDQNDKSFFQSHQNSHSIKKWKLWKSYSMFL